MADYKYTIVPAQLAGFFSKIRTVGKPAKANADWLSSIGFSSSNQRSFIPILKQVGFLDSSGSTTSLWQEYRGDNHRNALGKGIKSAYPELFDTYPDACNRGDAELESFFRSQTDNSEDVVKRITSTFKALCSLADISTEPSLDAEPPNQAANENNGKAAVPDAAAKPKQTTERPGPSVHIDIQVHISPESSLEQIDQIFSSMAKHLYKSDN